MQAKKNNKANLEKYRFTFFLIGLCLTLSAVLMAFEYGREAGDIGIFVNETDNMFEEDQVPITRMEEKKLPPPPPPAPKITEVLQIVDDTEDIDDAFKPIDVESYEDDVVEIVKDLKPEDEEEVFTVFEKKPEFPGGLKALGKYLSNHLKYPTLARENGIEGKVFVKFVVNSKGKVDRVSVLRGTHPLLDDEAVRVVKIMPDWKPAMNQNKCVSVWYTVPISFNLN